MRPLVCFLAILVSSAVGLRSAEGGELKHETQILLSFGCRAPRDSVRSVQFAGRNALIETIRGERLESGDRAAVLSRLKAGGGDRDDLVVTVSWDDPQRPKRAPQEIWEYFFRHTDPGAAARVGSDPALVPDAPVITVRTAPDGTRGFSFALSRLMEQKALWLPDHDVFITLADAPVDFEGHIRSLTGERVLSRVAREPEATLSGFTARWEDMGNPLVWNPDWSTTWREVRGHIVGLSPSYGSLYKFGIDRYGNIRPDFASPYQFRLDILQADSAWESQEIVDGLPVMRTVLRRGGQSCAIDQFAMTWPEEPAGPREINAPNLLLSRMTFTGQSGPVALGLRFTVDEAAPELVLNRHEDRWYIAEKNSGRLCLEIGAPEGLAVTLKKTARDEANKTSLLEVECAGTFPREAARELVIKLASPPVPADRIGALARIDYETARKGVADYWTGWLARGAYFQVPEPEINELFKASLWHALRLPRIRTDRDGREVMDLPYTNFAYGQLGIEWPVNQTVYVDYMLYGLRGYADLAERELAATFDINLQRTIRLPGQAIGRVGGFADWLVYTPSTLYTIGQCYLLSHDRAFMERLLPDALLALDWCLSEVRKARNADHAPGLVHGPLNDLSHEESVWAFSQAYFSAAFETFGEALRDFGHPRAEECLAASSRMKNDIAGAFGRASVEAPVVQLADGTWINYVPSDALTPRRLLETWYPTDVDTGPLHLARLGAVDPAGPLATWMLHDHEDNLFFRNWGAANEPVYNQQAMVYLMRDEPEAAIRAFYSMTACAFSRGQLEPVEHRWAWGQYFGPPSTDGAWFELLRMMLVRETEGGLLLGQAAPRAWFENGKRITVTSAPTWFGPLDLTYESRTARGAVDARVRFTEDRRPAELRVRFRHPEGKTIRKVEVNGKAWSDFDTAKEWVRIERPKDASYDIRVRYE